MYIDIRMSVCNAEEGAHMKELKKFSAKLKKEIDESIEVTETNGAIRLEGTAKDWDSVIKAGEKAAELPYRGVINDIKAHKVDSDRERKPDVADSALLGHKPDILIVGGGIIGCSIARELSKYNLDILLVDKESDLGLHQSSRNDGMVHPGVMPKPGTKKAYYNVRGNEMYPAIAKDLNVAYRTIGTYVMFENRVIDFLARSLISRAEKNGVKGVRHVSRKQIIEDEPNIAESVVGGIYMPTTGVCPPYEMTIAMGESAAINGAKIRLSTYVTGMKIENGRIHSVKTNRGEIFPKIVINAAGLFSDRIAQMAGDRFFTIHPRKGQVALLDKEKGHLLDSVVSIVSLKSAFQKTKGGGLVKTADGNILVGPSAYEQPYKEDYSTDYEDIDRVLNKNLRYIKGLEKKDIITYLAGTRAATYKEDFIVEVSLNIDNLIHAAGIQSPGYASAPAIAIDVAEMAVKKAQEYKNVIKKENFIKDRKGITRIAGLDEQSRQKFIELNKDYGKILCRCEEISKGEILDAVNSPVPAHTVDAVKRRTRAGMGRCQGGFCKPLIAEIIHQETGIEIDRILCKGGGLQ